MLQESRGGGLAPALACVTGQKETATGTFNLSGELLSKSKPEAFVQSLAGNLAFTAKEGRIYQFGLLAKILAILNVTEITFVNLLSVERNIDIQGYRYSSRNLGFKTSRQIDDSRGIIDSREVSNQDFYDFSKFTEHKGKY